jgi:hypothetical protein
MSSCSASSNIFSNINAIGLNSVGSRIIATVPKVSTEYSVDPQIVAGSVVRYDVSNPDSKHWIEARANLVENAEVVGVVESIDDTNLYIVIFGQINYPTGRLINQTVEGYLDGASGGNDIYFLSAGTSGDLVNIAPDNPTEIVKPVLQMADDGTNNAIVLNYIGYAVGGEIAGTDESELVGQVMTYIDNGQPLNNNFIKVSDGVQSLSVSNYEELFNIFGSTYGATYVMTLSTPVVTSLKGKTLIQKNKGKNTRFNIFVSDVDTTNNTITFDKNGDTFLDLTKPIYDQNKAYDVASIRQTHFNLPQITVLSNIFNVAGTGSLLSQTAQMSVAMRARTLTGVNIPSRVKVKELEVTTKLTTKTNDSSEISDINDKVNTLDTQLASLKTRLGVS